MFSCCCSCLGQGLGMLSYMLLLLYIRLWASGRVNPHNHSETISSPLSLNYTPSVNVKNCGRFSKTSSFNIGYMNIYSKWYFRLDWLAGWSSSASQSIRRSCSQTPSRIANVYICIWKVIVSNDASVALHPFVIDGVEMWKLSLFVLLWILHHKSVSISYFYTAVESSLKFIIIEEVVVVVWYSKFQNVIERIYRVIKQHFLVS